jgi:hypothetical protein
VGNEDYKILGEKKKKKYKIMNTKLDTKENIYLE